ncbi:Demethylsterigmatocystin 6-O-methyltransferase [Grifola frondosa]|uniref:Demethylsterigmatocystin 6-O-methyltransferase n=1 Tax=Grifola frondosa TaxID=5627 RepID=A0A1C7LT14_GRIFR|nr:Demethylsterigmatocystin 6-O-methyltransferase [Grifola frondosa]
MVPERSELDLLQNHLNASIDAIREELAIAALPPLSSQAVKPHALDDLLFLPSPRLFEARRLAIACVGQLKNLLQLPFEKALEQSFAEHDTACMEVFTRAGVVDCMASLPDVSAGIHTKELGQRLDLDPRKLTTILRYLSVDGWVREITESVFALNRPALDLVSGKHSRAWVEYPRQAIVAPSLHDWVTDPRWRHSQSPVETAFQLAKTTNLGYWKWLDERPADRASFASAVQSLGECHSQGVLSDYPWNSLPDGETIVDCGGGLGLFSVALAGICPSNKFIIQDLEGVIERAATNVETLVPGALESGRIAVEAHDFFSHMPHRGDDYSFLFRHVLHDWPADEVIQILTHVAQAAGPKSRILIVENIVPTPSADTDEKAADSITLDDLARAERYQPLTPQAISPAISERTLAQWRDLIEASHLKISGVFPLRAVLSVIECRVAD